MNNNGINVGGNLTLNNGNVSNTVGTGTSGRHFGVDVLIMAAMQEEYDATQAVTGASRWQEHGTGGAEPYSTLDYRTLTGHILSVALARPTKFGGRSISALTTTLTNQLQPSCLAMCGVCAGKPGAVAPGDVIVAAPAYEWDEGKHIDEAFHADHQQFPLDSRWVRAVQEFNQSGLPSYGTATAVEADVWFLERLYKNQNPRKHPARDRYLPDAAWRERLAQLETDGLIRWEQGELVLTEAGRDRIQRALYIDVAGPQRLPFTVSAGPMASGSAVMSDSKIWDRLEITQRKILALEMEAATIATVAHERQVPHWLVAKGVMDHADLDKDDRFKTFAARASAEVLFALLGQLLPPAATATPPVRSAGTIPGKVKREIVRRLTYDWQDLADVVGVPSYETRKFRSGDEPRELWTWLESRGLLSGLPGALDEIGRSDLAGLLRPYR